MLIDAEGVALPAALPSIIVNHAAARASTSRNSPRMSTAATMSW